MLGPEEERMRGCVLPPPNFPTGCSGEHSPDQTLLLFIQRVANVKVSNLLDQEKAIPEYDLTYTVHKKEKSFFYSLSFVLIF